MIRRRKYLNFTAKHTLDFLAYIFYMYKEINGARNYSTRFVTHFVMKEW